jgi:hypothetical protein
MSSSEFMVFGFCFGLLRFRGGEGGVGAGVAAQEEWLGLGRLGDEDGGAEFFEGEEDDKAGVDFVAGEVDACVCGGV